MPLSDYPVRITIPVLWGNQDLFGHVNNCVHVRWLESGRVAYWDQGTRSVMERQDWGPILANVTCNFLWQVRYPDTVEIGSRISKLGRTSLTMEHAIYSQAEERIVSDGHSIVVVFNYKTQRPAHISPELRAAIEATEGKPIEA